MRQCRGDPSVEHDQDTIAVPQIVLGADSTSVRAILIMATNQKREADPKLAAYEAELQRNLPLSSFQFVGEGSATVSGAGRASITLARGHRVELAREKAGGRGIGVMVHWLNGQSTVMNMSLTLEPGVPAVLGRRPGGDGETPIVLLIAR